MQSNELIKYLKLNKNCIDIPNCANIKITNLIKKISENPNILKQDFSYIHSYPHILNYFADLFKDSPSNLDEGKFTLGVHMIYGWMPTHFSFKYEVLHSKEKQDFDDFGELYRFVESRMSLAWQTLWKIKTYENREYNSNFHYPEDDIKTLILSINKSTVFAAKLLHFVCPKSFPVFDSNIQKIVYKNSGTSFENRFRFYKKYLHDFQELKAVCRNDESVGNSVTNLRDALGYSDIDFTFARAIEISIFSER